MLLYDKHIFFACLWDRKAAVTACTTPTPTKKKTHTHKTSKFSSYSHNLRNNIQINHRINQYSPAFGCEVEQWSVRAGEDEAWRDSISVFEWCARNYCTEEKISSEEGRKEEEERTFYLSLMFLCHVIM